MIDINYADSNKQTGLQSSFHSVLNDTNEVTKVQHTQSPFDINALFSAAVLNAVNAATAPLLARIELLERSLVVADKAAQGNESDLISRVALLEDKLDNIKDASDERIQEIADDAARMVLSEHAEEYDHDEYDRFDDRVEEKMNEAIDEIDIEDKVRDAVRELSFTVTVD